MRVVIVGNGMAGARLANELSASDLSVTVLGAEEHPAYNRILLSSVLAGRHRPHDIELVASSGPKTRTGVTVGSIDRDARTVTTTDGERIAYDHLVLATGSRALVPPLPGIEAALTFRTLDDCRRILAAAQGARRALVLGGGLLGLEAARGLAGRGLRVEVVHAVGHLMERQLDPAASRVLERTLTGLGITVHLDARAVAVHRRLPSGRSSASRPDETLELSEEAAPRARSAKNDTGRGAGTDTRGSVALELSDGRMLTADLLVVACGVRPETALAAEAGLAVERGIVVDERLCTGDPRVCAIGDCAQINGEISGLVAPAWEQARVVARRLIGEAGAVYRPQPPITRLKAQGIDLAAMGSLGDADEDLSFTDAVRGTYARLLIRDDRLAGAVLLGDNPSVGQVIQLFDRNLPVPADRRTLLLGRAFGAFDRPSAESPALMPDAATVCQCNSVSKGALVRSWRDGRRSLESVVAQTKATTGCGSCRDAVEGIVCWLEAA